jgi:hypothetical protein
MNQLKVQQLVIANETGATSGDNVWTMFALGTDGVVYKCDYIFGGWVPLDMDIRNER